MTSLGAFAFQRSSHNIFMLERLEITFCKNADAFAGFHSSDDGFHSGVAKKVWSYFCTGKQFHAKLVDGCVGWHEKKRLTGDFFYGKAVF